MTTTRPIGPGTVNTALNMTREERALWGRVACENDASLNQYLQECALSGLKKFHPALAEEIEKIRRARGMVVKLGKGVVALLLAGLMALAGSDQRLVRFRNVRRRNDDAGFVVEMA